MSTIAHANHHLKVCSSLRNGPGMSQVQYVYISIGVTADKYHKLNQIIY